jgi:tRNA(adenine34) deaminase
MWSRRAFGSSVAAIACSCSVPTASTGASVHPIDLSAIPASVHEQAMRLAIAEARGNPAFPFGAVILRAADRHVMATGVNRGAANPTFHGEIVAINDYVARHGNRGWGEAILYTTGEPCPMCMSGVVWGTSIEQLRQFGINQILIPATTVTDASAFYHGGILGHVLQSETDAQYIVYLTRKTDYSDRLLGHPAGQQAESLSPDGDGAAFDQTGVLPFSIRW